MPGFVSAAAAKVRQDREEARAKEAEQTGGSSGAGTNPRPAVLSRGRRMSESPTVNRKPMGSLPTVHASSSIEAGSGVGGGGMRKTVSGTNLTGGGVGSRPSSISQNSPLAGSPTDSGSPHLPCIACKCSISVASRFCSSCGVKQERGEEPRPFAPTAQPAVVPRQSTGGGGVSLPPPQQREGPPLGPPSNRTARDESPSFTAGGGRTSRSTSLSRMTVPGTSSSSMATPAGGGSSSNVGRPRSRGRVEGTNSNTTSPPPRATTPTSGARAGGGKSAGSKPSGGANSASDNFPKMPLASEMTSKRDVFMAKIDTYAGKRFTAADFENSKHNKLSPLDAPGQLFAEADTRVFVRCRPILGGETDKTPVVTKAEGCKDTLMLVPQVSLSGACTLSPYSLPVDATFSSENTNADMYAYLSELVDLALRGGSSSILCYGQTGSGKTFTTTGLLQNMASQIEEAIAAGKVEITATFVELHHEGCRDLISCEPAVNICEVGNKIELQKSQANPVTSARNFNKLVETAVGNRSTKATLKNAGSSRSHMVIRIIVTDVETPWANPGVLCIADLAGSESNSDSKDHDKERVIETKFINSSLMTLKDCIRARGMAATSSKHVHIPYRQTSLTTIMKDSFELVVKRPTKAAVIACVSPLFMDIRHSGNTVRYASLLYVSPKKRVVLADNPEDPHCWDRPEVLKRLAGFGGAQLTNPELVLPEGDGRALVLLAEAEFIKRVIETHPKVGDKKAAFIYAKVWRAVVDSRTKTRKDVLKVNPNANREMATAVS